MESLIGFFLHQWQRKLVALVTALTIWIFVNHSITATKTIPFVPVRIINLPIDKTIQGLLPNGFLSKRMTLTITGTKDIIEQLEPGDLEVVIDIGNQPSEGAVQITKKNLVSLNPNINLFNHITSLSHSELFIKTSAMLKDKIPVTVRLAPGNPPAGYEFLDIWPVKLMQTVSGPQEQITSLKEKGLELVLNPNDITKEQLDALKAIQKGPYDDEVSFYVPEQWKKIVIPSLSNVPEPLNDPEAKYLQIDFLKKEFVPIKGDLPIQVFYPLKYSATLNPNSFPLTSNSVIQSENGISVLKTPLFAYNVSKVFFDIVKNNLAINLVATPKSERELLEWDIQFIDDAHLEDTYAAFMLSSIKPAVGSKTQEREKLFRQRFQTYLQNFALYLPSKQPLTLEATIEDRQIVVQVPHTHSLPSKLKAPNAR